MKIFKSNILRFFIKIFKILFFSISSMDFYKNVIKNYKGYGVKYFLNIVFLGEIIFLIFFIIYCSQIEGYFSKGKISNLLTKNIEYIISQIPEMKYSDGKLSNKKQQDFIYLYDISKKPIITIDIGEQSHNHSTPVILSSEYIYLQPFSKHFDKVAKYKILDLLGKEEKILTQDFILAILYKIFLQFQDSFTKNLILISLLLFILLSVNLIIYQLEIILLIYIITNLLLFKISFKDIFRTVLFASGIFSLFYPVVFFFGIISIKHLFLIKILPYFLMTYSFLKMKNKKL
ncbi:MAG: hypothetical protein ISN64_00945 [Rickettsia sp.]|nr:hypothetical protein [Rickettsia sp.]